MYIQRHYGIRQIARMRRNLLAQCLWRSIFRTMTTNCMHITLLGKVSFLFFVDVRFVIISYNLIDKRKSGITITTQMSIDRFPRLSVLSLKWDGTYISRLYFPLSLLCRFNFGCGVHKKRKRPNRTFPITKFRRL